jgi:hypothetical protein
MCRMRWFLAVLRSFFHSSWIYTFYCHSSPLTILPSSVTSSCHLFLGLSLGLVSKFIYSTLLGILFSSILCTFMMLLKFSKFNITYYHANILLIWCLLPVYCTVFVFVISYCSDMFQPQFLAIFKEVASIINVYSFCGKLRENGGLYFVKHSHSCPEHWLPEALSHISFWLKKC